MHLIRMLWVTWFTNSDMGDAWLKASWALFAPIRNNPQHGYCTKSLWLFNDDHYHHHQGKLRQNICANMQHLKKHFMFMNLTSESLRPAFILLPNKDSVILFLSLITSCPHHELLMATSCCHRHPHRKYQHVDFCHIPSLLIKKLLDFWNISDWI